MDNGKFYIDEFFFNFGDVKKMVFFWFYFRETLKICGRLKEILKIFLRDIRKNLENFFWQDCFGPPDPPLEIIEVKRAIFRPINGYILMIRLISIRIRKKLIF